MFSVFHWFQSSYCFILHIVQFLATTCKVVSITLLNDGAAVVFSDPFVEAFVRLGLIVKRENDVVELVTEYGESFSLNCVQFSSIGFKVFPVSSFKLFNFGY